MMTATMHSWNMQKRKK